MTKKLTMANKVFTGDTNNSAEEKASEWANKALREDYRVAWNIDGIFHVEVFVILHEEVVL